MRQQMLVRCPQGVNARNIFFSYHTDERDFRQRVLALFTAMRLAIELARLQYRYDEDADGAIAPGELTRVLGH